MHLTHKITYVSDAETKWENLEYECLATCGIHCHIKFNMTNRRDGATGAYKMESTESGTFVV